MERHHRVRGGHARSVDRVCHGAFGKEFDLIGSRDDHRPAVLQIAMLLHAHDPESAEARNGAFLAPPQFLANDRPESLKELVGVLLKKIAAQHPALRPSSPYL